MTHALPASQDQENHKDLNFQELLFRKPIQSDHNVVTKHLYAATVLITGAAGSIGSELAIQVCQLNPHELTLVDQSETQLSEIENTIAARFPHIALTTYVADITDVTRIGHIIQVKRPDILFHAAAYKHVPVMEKHPYEAVRTNVFGTKNLADLAIRYGIGQFIFISTDKAVNPVSVMGATKRLAELYIRHIHGNANTKFTITRFGNVLGSSGSFITIFKKQIEKGGPVTVTHPDATRYLMTPAEACQLVLQATSGRYHGKVLFFDMGRPVSILSVAEQMIILNGLNPRTDISICYTGLRPGEKLHEELLNEDETELATSHPQMRIAVCNSSSTLNFEEVFDNLSHALNQGNAERIVTALKQILTEYKTATEPDRLVQLGLSYF